VELLRQHVRLVSEPDADVRGMATSGKAPIGADLLDRLPGLELISCLGAGTDGLDMEAIGRRGIRIETTSRVLAGDVADVAMGLVIALARDFRGADFHVRAGRWAAGRYPLGRALGGARLGILGLGTIGEAVARRGVAFGMSVGYHNRAPKPGSAHRFFDRLEALAAWSDFLVLCCPGGAATQHLVEARIFAALGAEGWLVNVARGSVVDEAALMAALEAGGIAGAGLDVFADEPHPHPGLMRENVILLPHIGSATAETRDAMARAMAEALVRGLAPR
jgi:lactate dehydrogenase-like 2-hydroxyacid dehydrogenase